MNKTWILVPVVAVLAACSSTPKETYERRAYEERERQEKLVERAIDRAPKWMTEVPRSKDAVYQNGTALSPDMSMSVNKAKTVALGKICMAAGGRVNQQSKIYRTDSENASTELSELAIKSFCPGVDITGIEVVESKIMAEGAQFRTYILVALPTGEANQLQRAKDQREQRRLATQRSGQVFQEMENQSKSAQ